MDANSEGSLTHGDAHDFASGVSNEAARGRATKRYLTASFSSNKYRTPYGLEKTAEKLIREKQDKSTTEPAHEWTISLISGSLDPCQGRVRFSVSACRDYCYTVLRRTRIPLQVLSRDDAIAQGHVSFPIWLQRLDSKDSAA